MIGVRRAACPSCGSAACAVQSLRVCRHTGHLRQPDANGLATVPAKGKKSTSNKGRNPEKETT